VEIMRLPGQLSVEINTALTLRYVVSALALVLVPAAGWAQLSIPPAMTQLADGYALLARTIMDNTLNDFPSARIRNVKARYSRRADNGQDHINFCGEVNAKNAAGGYTGWRPFALLTGSDLQPTMEGTRVWIGGDFAADNLIEAACPTGAQAWLPKDYTPDFTPKTSTN
jgi:hypothetical protein